ncbi:MAG: hypothetical protein FVQ77_04305 [Cytophagales bacterium]|nr:hypothetical protein [Cytophagales bacterium]
MGLFNLEGIACVIIVTGVIYRK